MDQNTLRSPVSPMSTVQSRRRPDTPSLSLIFPAPPLRLDPITPPRRDSDTLPSDIQLVTRSEPIHPPRRISSRRSHACLRPTSILPPVPPLPGSLDVTVDSPPTMTLAQMPPTPTASLHSPSRRRSLEKLASRNSGSVSAKTKMFGGAISPRQSVPGPSAQTSLPPTPPTLGESSTVKALKEVFNTPEGSTLAFSEPQVPQRPRRGRRPMSAFPRPQESPSRSSSDDLSTHQLDVDLDAYSTTEYDTEENALDREPTLSFLTTSTIESTHGTPSSIGVTYGEDGKPLVVDPEPRIRMRTTAGRSTAYSSAESSMASGAYSYHAYADNNIYHPHPPPLPNLPHGLKENVGLGFSAPDLAIPTSFADESSPSVVDPNSPAHSFAHRPWKRDAVTRMRSDSASSDESAEPTDDVDLSASTELDGFPVEGLAYDQVSWQKPEHEAEAVALVEEGKSSILDRARLEAMGGLEGLTEDVVATLEGTTHILLADVGSNLIEMLSSLLFTVSSTLVVLDIADNGLSFLPESLRHCTLLEELNISENPLRALPTWIAELVEMRMLVIDGCRLQHIPQDLSTLGRLHTLCARRNRLVSLPSWLCLLGQLETLRVDGNPFSPEWLSIVSPILATPPASATPASAPPPIIRSRSSSLAQSLDSRTDTESLTSPIMPAAQSMLTLDPIAEDHPHSAPPPSGPDGLVDSPDRMTASPSSPEKMSTLFESPRGLRKMRSAGDLLDPRPATTHNVAGPSKRNDSLRGFSRNGDSALRSLGAREGGRIGSTFTLSNYDESTSPSKGRPSTSGGKPKSDKWGFLRKMSMHRLKADKQTTAASASANLKFLPPLAHHAHSDLGPNTMVHPRPPLQSAHSAQTLPSRKLATAEFGSMPSTPATIAMPAVPHTMPLSLSVFGGGARQTKRKSFLLVDEPPSLSVNIPPSSPFLNTDSMFAEVRPGTASPAIGQLMEPPTASERPLPETPDEPVSTVASTTLGLGSPMELDTESRYSQGLESIKSYLRDLFDLSRPAVEPYGSFEVISTNESGSEGFDPASPASVRESRSSIADARRSRRPTLGNQSSCASVIESERSTSSASMASHENVESGVLTGKKFKNDASKRARVLREIWETERTYVRGLGELVTIYVKPSATAVNSGKSTETLIPSSERKVVFGGIESILSIHRDNLLPALEKAVRPLLEGTDDEAGELSTRTAHAVGEVFRTYIAYMKQYSSYINNFDNALSRMKTWTAPTSTPGTPGFPMKPGRPGTAGAVSAGAVSVGMGLSSLSLPLADATPHSGNQMTTSQKKRVKGFLKRCREHPLHSQINLESYLLLPIQRVPRYKLLLEDLAMCTMPQTDGPRDTLDDALNEIASLASLMNEEKRDADSRLRLLHWQKRITTRGPSPLVQPHRRLVMDGALTLIRLVKKSSTFVEVDNTSSSLSTKSSSNDAEQTITPSKVVIPVEHITPEPMNRQIMLILCSDLLALVQQRQGGGWDGQVDLFNVLRMGTLREPASIVHGNVLRVVDNKSIYYFNGGTPEMILQWSRAINSARKR